MRIVITKDGTKIIESLSRNNSLDYNPDINQLNLGRKNLKKNRRVNQIGTQRKNKLNINNIKTNENNIDINDMLNTLINKDNSIINKEHIHNLKIINLKNKKKVKLPKIIENKYLVYDTFKTENKKQYIPKILLSINNNINNDLLNKKYIKRTNTFSNIIRNKSENNINKEEPVLPTIRETFPLKYIIEKESIKRLNKEMNILEKNYDNEKKLFPNNYFIKKSWENSKKNYELSLNNEINSKNINLIEYLNRDKNISNIFLQKFSKIDTGRIDKLEFISKKLL